jgi:hypothetical protein
MKNNHEGRFGALLPSLGDAFFGLKDTPQEIHERLDGCRPRSLEAIAHLARHLLEPSRHDGVILGRQLEAELHR